MKKGVKARWSGRRQSKNVIDSRGHARTTEKSPRLHSMGVSQVKQMKKIGRVQSYARNKGAVIEISKQLKELGW